MEYLIENILFLDIETVSEFENYHEMPIHLKKLWQKKSSYFKNSDTISIDELYRSRAGIFAEFSKIVCISMGYITNAGNAFRVKSFLGHNEIEILNQFISLIELHFSDQRLTAFCGHNIKEFDIPFICRRIIKNELEIPKILNVTGRKPWECEHLIDTLGLWKFGDYKHYSSIDLLAHVMGIPTPKDDITGADVAKVYYEDKDLERIKDYCEKDVITVARVLLRFKGESEIAEEHLHSVQSDRIS